MIRDDLLEQLKRDEGSGPKKLGRFMPYIDTVGKTTIGYGWNLSDNGIPQFVADWLLDYAINEASLELQRKYPWLSGLDGTRYAVLINMAVNMGLPRLSGFRKMFAALKRKDYDAAAVEMLDSTWRAQVKGRALRLARQLRTGEWQD
jgi:lysozyme